MNVAVQEQELPVRLRFEHPLSDEELLRFCAENELLRVERDANGELLVMSPAGGGASRKNSNIIYQLTKWTEERNSGVAFDSSGGFTLPDGSMRSPDAAWIPWSRWNALSTEQQESFCRCVQSLLSNCARRATVSQRCKKKCRPGSPMARSWRG